MYLSEMKGRMLRGVVEAILENEDTGENLERALNSKIEDVFPCIGLNGWNTTGGESIVLKENDYLFVVGWSEKMGAYCLGVDMGFACGEMYSEKLMNLVDVAKNLVEIEY